MNIPSHHAHATPSLLIVRPRWGNDDPLPTFLQQAAFDGFDAVELSLPTHPAEQKELVDRATDLDLGLFGEVATGDWWIPKPQRTEQEHLDDLCRALDACSACNAWKLNAMTGYDAWSITQSVNFLGICQEEASKRDVFLCIETHRSRSLNTPWSTLEILKQLPDLALTCDFSHWVVICERLLEGCEAAISAAAHQAGHIHARVGHAQGPQVPDPAAPEFSTELAAHLSWWEQCWESMAQRGFKYITMNPEFGVDRYLPLLPYTEQPVADLQSIHLWMAQLLRQKFKQWIQA